MNMKKILTGYINKVEFLLQSDPTDADREEIIKAHLTQIGFFQHERLVHLIVTVTFGLLLALISVLLFLADDFRTFAGALALFAIIAVTLVFYVMHYFFLENNVQKLYSLYDELLNKKHRD